MTSTNDSAEGESWLSRKPSTSITSPHPPLPANTPLESSLKADNSVKYDRVLGSSGKMNAGSGSARCQDPGVTFEGLDLWVCC